MGKTRRIWLFILLDMFIRSLHLMRKIEEHEVEKYLTVDDYMLDKVLDKITEIINIEKLDDIKILIETDNKLSDDITFKNIVILTR